MKVLWSLALALALAPAAAAQDDNVSEDPVRGPDDEGWSPIVVLAVVVGLALLIGLVVAVMGRRT